MKRYFVYILCSQKNGTLYIGVTSDLARRIYEHKQGIIPGFAKDYGVNILVHVEEYCTMDQAIKREKALKHWNRAWKIELLEKNNPGWDDLS
ncbi:MAG TPA: GIY-YIG nuclease family protein, partial [Candidatus Saccharimonadales bacterium]|nr:GIY-YIG nuclease family protein [Candidatus Saccharimonadales bacterium]